ncbi:MAG: winged helix-turn-helix domain-containing protein [Candidatus Gracilibacteria bacterium]
MQAILFSSNPHECIPLISGMRSENIFVDAVEGIDAEYKNQLLSGTHFFFFHHEIRADDFLFLQLVRCIKPAAVTILLDPLSADGLEQVDIAFAKPYSYAVMAIYMQRKLLEKRERFFPREIRVGGLTLDVQKRTLSSSCTTISLKNREFALLQYFFVNRGKILSRSDILECVWDRNTSMTTNTIDVHVSRLRKKLELCDADRYLQTVPCVGYVWSCDAM